MALLSILLCATSSAQGQQASNTSEQTRSHKPSQPAGELLPDRLGDRWRAIGQAQILDARRFSSLPDADVYGEYGLQRIISRVYTDGKTRVSVEVFELNFVSNAYGLFTFNRGRLPATSHEFYEGRYVVRVTTSSPNEQPDRSLFEAIKPNLISGEGRLPSLPSRLPEQGKIAESEKYIVGPAALTKLKSFGDLKGAINFGVGVEVVTADYHSGGGQMSLIIVEYYTPQSASDGHAKFQSHFNALPQDEKDRRILKRIGNYVVEMVNIQDMPAAQNVIDRIKYEASVYWVGRKLSDIPLEFRPPDPVALEEARRTTQVLLRSFYWMGAMILSAFILGLAAGAALFWWNRYRRRKLGLDNLFSDAGGTVRLNLDDYLLPEDSDVKRIGKGDD